MTSKPKPVRVVALNGFSLERGKAYVYADGFVEALIEGYLTIPELVKLLDELRSLARAQMSYHPLVRGVSVRYPGQGGKPQEGILLAVHGDGAYVSTPAHAPVLVPTRDVEVLSGLVQVSLTEERENGLA